MLGTDHAALTWLYKSTELLGHNARWLEFLVEFNFDVVHRPGTKHGNTDALSRMPMPGGLTSVGENADEEGEPKGNPGPVYQLIRAVRVNFHRQNHWINFGPHRWREFARSRTRERIREKQDADPVTKC